MKYWSIFILSYLFLISYGEKARYDNYRVYKISINTNAELDVFQELEELSDGINFLDEPNIHQPFHILVAPHKLAHIVDLFDRLHIKNEVQHTNFQQ